MQNEKRYDIQIVNPDKLKLSTNIQDAIYSMNKKYGNMGRGKVKVTEHEITIGLGNDEPFMVKAFWDYMAEMRDEVATLVAEKGYTFEKWEIIDGHLVLKFSKVTAEKRISLIQFISSKISSIYAEYGQTSTAKVSQNSQEIQIRFNSENPYLDKEFFEFLDKVHGEINGRLKAEGFVYQNTECLYDFIIWHFRHDNKA